MPPAKKPTATPQPQAELTAATIKEAEQYAIQRINDEVHDTQWAAVSVMLGKLYVKYFNERLGIE